MAVRILQFNESELTPIDDAELYRFLLSNESGIFKGCNVTKGAGNKIKISSGRMVVCGRVIVLEDEEINAKLSPSGTQNGRLILRVDISKNLEEVAHLHTQVSANLPDLVQEDINAGGTVYELLLASYTCNEIDISNLTVNENVRIETVIDKLNKKVDKIQGKGLSTEDYTTAEKNKLAGIAAGANKYVHPSKHSLDIITETSAKKIFTSAERSKLNGIQSGAQVNRAISSSVSSTSTSTAANSKAVKTAYDKAKDAYGKVTSAAYIRDRIKTVDGSGSGLDADLLDGKHGGDFLQKSSIILEPAFGTLSKIIYSPCSEPYGICVDGDYLWVVGKGGVHKIDKTGDVITSFSGPYEITQGVAVDGNYLWVRTRAHIYKTDKTGNVITAIESPVYNSGGICVDENYLWITDYSTKKLIKFSKKGTLISSIDVPVERPYGICVDGDYLWVVDKRIRKIYKLTKTGTIVTNFISSDEAPCGVCVDENYLWITDYETRKIYKFRKEGNLVIDM